MDQPWPERLVKAEHEVDLLGGDQHPIEVAGEEGQFGGRFFGELHGHLAYGKKAILAAASAVQKVLDSKKNGAIHHGACS